MRLVSVFAAWVVASLWPINAYAQSAPIAASAPRPVADFAQLQFIEGPELSPDGTHVAAKVAIRGKQVLAILPLFGDQKAPPALLRLGENELVSWQWVNDDWLVIQLGNAQKFEGEDIYITRLAGVSIDGKTIKPIAFNEGGQSASVIWTAIDGSPRILMARQKSIYSGEDFWPVVEEVDVSKARLRPVVRGQEGVMKWVADASGAVRMGIGFNDGNRTSRLLYRPDGKGAFRILDRADQRQDERLTVPFLMTSDKTKSMTTERTRRVRCTLRARS